MRFLSSRLAIIFPEKARGVGNGRMEEKLLPRMNTDAHR